MKMYVEYETSSHNQNVQVQYVYHCCLCLIFVWTIFGEFLKILGKWSEIFGKTSKTSLSVFLFTEQNIAWVLVDMESLLVFNLISHSFPAKKKMIPACSPIMIAQFLLP